MPARAEATHIRVRQNVKAARHYRNQSFSRRDLRNAPRKLRETS